MVDRQSVGRARAPPVEAVNRLDEAVAALVDPVADQDLAAVQALVTAAVGDGAVLDRWEPEGLPTAPGAAPTWCDPRRAWSSDELLFLRRVERLVALGVRAGGSQALRRSESRYRTLFDRSPSMFFLVDAALRVVEVNASAVSGLGYPADALIGRPVSDVFHPADRAQVERHLRSCFASPERVFRWEGRKLRADGSVVVVREVARSLAGDGEPTAFVVCDDVTEARRLADTLARAQRTESLGLLAAGVAHDFGNALTAIDAHADLARDEVGAGTASGERLSRLLGVSGRASALVRQLLVYAGRAPTARIRLRLDQVVREASPMVAAALAPGVVLELDLAADLPEVEADPAQLEQVFVNLMLNASCALQGRGGRVVVRTWSDRDRVALEVSDDGPGMDEATLGRVFEPFFSTRGQGHGLGLATSASLVRAHGGTLDADSAPDRGARFVVRLPVARTPEV